MAPQGTLSSGLTCSPWIYFNCSAVQHCFCLVSLEWLAELDGSGLYTTAIQQRVSLYLPVQSECPIYIHYVTIPIEDRAPGHGVNAQEQM